MAHFSKAQTRVLHSKSVVLLLRIGITPCMTSSWQSAQIHTENDLSHAFAQGFFQRLDGFSIYLGNASDWASNTVCASGQLGPRGPSLFSDFTCIGQGRYLFIVIPNRSEYLTLCEVEVYDSLLSIPVSNSCV